MHSFWWQDLQMVADRRDGRLLRLRSLPNFDLTPIVRGLPYAIHKAAEAIENLPRADRDAVAAELRTLAERPAEGLAAADIRWLASAGFEIGFHTRRHYLLTTLAPPELATAMTDGRHELEALIGQQLKMIAYPHGKANAIVADRARSAGYELGFTAFPTCAGPTTDPLLIGRAEVPIGSLRDFVQMISKTFRDHGT
jgi:peptidoglycan/xylan/chitin deacetylase (PgdA/CDA1 family)